MPQEEFEIDHLETQLTKLMELDPADLVDHAADLAETLTVALDALEEEPPV